MNRAAGAGRANRAVGTAAAGRQAPKTWLGSSIASVRETGGSGAGYSARPMMGLVASTAGMSQKLHGKMGYS